MSDLSVLQGIYTLSINYISHSGVPVYEFWPFPDVLCACTKSKDTRVYVKRTKQKTCKGQQKKVKTVGKLRHNRVQCQGHKSVSTRDNASRTPANVVQMESIAERDEHKRDGKSVPLVVDTLAPEPSLPYSTYVVRDTTNPESRISGLGKPKHLGKRLAVDDTEPLHPMKKPFLTGEAAMHVTHVESCETRIDELSPKMCFVTGGVDSGMTSGLHVSSSSGSDCVYKANADRPSMYETLTLSNVGTESLPSATRPDKTLPAQLLPIGELNDDYMEPQTLSCVEKCTQGGLEGLRTPGFLSLMAKSHQEL